MSRAAVPTRFAAALESVDGTHDAWRPALAVVALLAAAVPFALRVARNVPGSPLASLAGGHEAAVVVGTLGPALAALGFALATTDRVERVALLGLAVFAPLALVADAAYAPAAAGVVLSGAVVAWRRLARARPTRVVPLLGRPLLAALAVAALIVALAASVGVASPAGRQVGTLLTLAAAVAAGLAVDARALDWALGIALAGVVHAAGASMPYVAGAIALVGGGAVGASLGTLSAGLGALAAATVATARRRALVPACGALLLCVAAVPVTVSRALAAALGVALLLGGEAT